MTAFRLNWLLADTPTFLGQIVVLPLTQKLVPLSAEQAARLAATQAQKIATASIAAKEQGVAPPTRTRSQRTP